MRLLGSRCGMRDAGCGMRDAGCGMRDAGCGIKKGVALSITCQVLFTLFFNHISGIWYPGSHISYPGSRITYYVLRINNQN